MGLTPIVYFVHDVDDPSGSRRSWVGFGEQADGFCKAGIEGAVQEVKATPRLGPLVSATNQPRFVISKVPIRQSRKVLTGRNSRERLDWKMSASSCTPALLRT